MRKITALFTKCLLLPAVLACTFMFSACQGDLTDEDMKLELLKNKSALGLDLLADEDDAASSQKKELIGTWLEITPEASGFYYIGGFIFTNDCIYSLDEFYDSHGNAENDRNIPIGKIGEDGPTNAQLQILVNAVKAEPQEVVSWSVSGNIITVTGEEVDDKGGTYEVYTETARTKYILNGNILTLFAEADPDDEGEFDKDGDGWEDEAAWILTKYPF